METKEISTPTEKRSNDFARVWQFVVKPHPSIQEIGEQRSAQLAILLIVTIGLFNVLGFVASLLRNGFTEAFGGFGSSLIGLPIAYGFAKSRNYRAGAFLFSFAFALSAYVDIIRQKGAADVAADVFVFVPLSLIVASTFLSSWAIFLLMGLNVGALVSLPLF